MQAPVWSRSTAPHLSHPHLTPTHPTAFTEGTPRRACANAFEELESHGSPCPPSHPPSRRRNLVDGSRKVQKNIAQNVITDAQNSGNAWSHIMEGPDCPAGDSGNFKPCLESCDLAEAQTKAIYSIETADLFFMGYALA